MNISEVFYLVAIIYMVIQTALLLFVGITILKLVRTLHTARQEIQQKINGFSVAKYSLQLAMLKNILKLFRRGGENK